jgi:hypothetical protein
MPERHATALAALTGAQLTYVDDARVLIMLDQPQATAGAMGAFLVQTTAKRPER